MPPNTIFQLDTDVALITGGGSGIGLGIAHAMIQAGARVILVGRREKELQSACKELGPQARYIAADINESKQLTSLVKNANQLWDAPISILVNNAGINQKKEAVNLSDSEFQHVMQTNVNAGFALSREIGKIMLANGRGSILFIASMASYLGIPSITSYTASKCAVVGLTRSLAAEWSAKGVRVNAIAPGWISTPMTDKAFSGDQARKEKVLSRTPLNKMGKPSDIGHAAVYLSSPAAHFITGVVLPVDGGASIGF